MAQSSDYLDLISDLLKNDIQSELSKIRLSRAWNGEKKPVGGGTAGYVGAISNRINTGTLYESVTVEPITDPSGNILIVVSFPAAEDYWEYVNYGRRGKRDSPTVKYPPLSAIQNWIAQRGLPQFRDRRGRFISNRDRAFLVQRSIGEYGIFPTLFLERGIEKSEERVESYLGEYGLKLFQEYVDKSLFDFEALNRQRQILKL
jgi:hypothetical protein